MTRPIVADILQALGRPKAAATLRENEAREYPGERADLADEPQERLNELEAMLCKRCAKAWG